MALSLIRFGRPPARPPARPQVVSYDRGGFYSDHYDNKAGGNVTRAATIIVYLADTPQGGATFFPRSVQRRVLRNVHVAQNA